MQGTELRDKWLKEGEDVDNIHFESEDQSQSIKEKQELLETREDAKEGLGYEKTNACMINDRCFRSTGASIPRFNLNTE